MEVIGPATIPALADSLRLPPGDVEVGLLA
jgi:hypothetical protein